MYKNSTIVRSDIGRVFEKFQNKRCKNCKNLRKVAMTRYSVKKFIILQFLTFNVGGLFCKIFKIWWRFGFYFNPLSSGGSEFQ